MPTENHKIFPGFQGNNPGNYSSPVMEESCDNSDKSDKVHLPHIRNGTPPRSKADRKANRFFKFSAEKQSFTENLLSFFTGHKEKGHAKSQTSPEELKMNGTMLPKDHHPLEVRRGEANNNERHTRSTNNQNNNKQQSLRRTNKTRITASTKNDLFRPVTGGSKGNGKGVTTEAESDVGGYENMYKMKQPAGKFSVPKKRSLEISEYIRRENYKYNERTAKQFLFQKWLKSTEIELPEQYPIDNGDSILLK